MRRGDELVPASWPEAIDAAVAGLQAAGSSVGVLVGGRLTLENAFAYSRFARAVVGTNSIDFRARPYGADEASFLAAHVVGQSVADAVTYADLEHAKKVVLVGFEPEDESPIVFLRLRKAWRQNSTAITVIAPFLSNGSAKMGATLLPTPPGHEVEALNGLADQLDAETIVLVGERASLVPGLLAAVAKLSARDVRWAWIPRRAGELAALEAGCLPGLLPGGRLVSDARARVDLQAAWGAAHLPEDAGLDAQAILQAADSGKLKALIAAGVDLDDMVHPAEARDSLMSNVFVVSLEQRRSSVTRAADVVFPVALLEEQNGTFINWEHRVRPVRAVNTRASNVMTDVRVLAALADAMGADLGMRSPAHAKAALDEISDWEGARAQFTASAGGAELTDSAEGVLLASWRTALDDSRCLDGAETLKRTAPGAVARISPATAAGLGVSSGDALTLVNGGAEVTLPAAVTTGMVDGVVWAPMNVGVSLLATLQARPGDRVRLVADHSAGGVA